MSRRAARLGVAGGLIGAAAGVTQATVGSRIPEWSGAKQEPVALGLLTVALSVLAVVAALWLARSDGSVRGRAAAAFGLVGPGLLGLSTVGRLWYVPAVLLVAGGILAIDDWPATAAALVADRWRLLLSAVAGCELLMAAGAAPVPLVVGAVGGLSLVAAAWLSNRPHWMVWALVGAGTIPFAALAWTSLVPLLLAAEAVGITVVLTRRNRASS